MKSRIASLALVFLLGATQAPAAETNKTPPTAGDTRVVTVGNLVFPSGLSGTHGSVLEQVDEVVQKAHDALARQGLGFGNMLQHTIYLRDGAAPPIEVLNRFHATATRIAPSLKTQRSVGTIVRLPEFTNKNTMVMLDLVAGAPAVKGQPDDFKRIPFKFGPKEIVETIAVDPIIFTAGLEAGDFEYRKLVPGIDEQIEVIVGKLQSSLQKTGLDVGNMISHNLYVRKGTDPQRVIQKFHEVTQRLAPGLKVRPSVGTLVVVDGMVSDGFLLEIDALAARPQQQGKPDTYKRVPFEQPLDIVKSVAVGDLVYLAGMEAMEGSKPVPQDVFAQTEVAVKRIDDTLRQSGLSIGDMIKYKLYVTKGSDVQQVRRKFLEEATRLAPDLQKHPAAETLVIVEGLASDQLRMEVTVIAAHKKK